MKKFLLLIFISIAALTSCNKLKNEQLNDNPYDKDYTGVKVAFPSQIQCVAIDTTHKYNKITVTTLTNQYEAIGFYINGVHTADYSRASFTNDPVHTETINANCQSGTTYIYQVQLEYEGNKTQLSDPVSFTTP